MAIKYEDFDIVEVAKQCGIQFHPYDYNRAEYKALCPFCGDTKYHLGLNREMDRFHCFRCKEKGNSVSLYAKTHNISNRKAYEIIRNGDVRLDKKIISYRNEPELPIRSIEDRHNVYYDLLSLLHLNKRHRKSLENRGLAFNHIHQFMYKSIPTDNVFRREVLEKLASKHNLLGIPGFYIDEHGDVQMYVKKCGGIFVPVCNYEGYIQGLQMRLDVAPNSGDKKYRWFSSKHFKDGTGAKPWIHIVGDTTAKEVCLTEGAMKADITSVLSNGQLFMAVPGVNAIQYLPSVIRDLRITKVYEAFDMDKRSNPQVKQALIDLRNSLDNIAVEWKSCSWNPAYKGLDDYFYAKSRHMQPECAAA